MANKRRLFKPITPRELARHLPGCPLRKCKAGAIFLKEGSRSSSCFLVVKGRVQVFKKTRNRKAFPLAFVETGEFIGEMAMLSGQKRGATAIAVSNVELIELRRNDFEKLFKKGNPFAARIALHFASLLATRSARLLSLLGREPQSVPALAQKQKPNVRQVIQQVYSLWAV